jgi:hypothetical protein
MVICFWFKFPVINVPLQFANDGLQVNRAIEVKPVSDVFGETYGRNLTKKN